MLVGIGFLTLALVLILAFVMPIINAIKASNGETPTYPLSITIIS